MSISIEIRTLTIGEILSRVDKNKINTFHNFNFSIRIATEYIDNVLAGIPLTPFIFTSNKNGIWMLHDGCKRLNSLKLFSNKNSYFELRNLKFVSEANNCAIDTLSGYYYNKFYDAKIQCIIINPGTSEDEQLEIIRRYKAVSSHD